MKKCKYGLKRALCAVLSLIMIISLTACSSAPAGASADGGDEVTTLDWYMYLDTIMPDQPKVVDKLNEYLMEKINVKVNLHTFEPGEYGTKMPVIISSGQDYDICYTNTWGDPNYIQTASTGAFMKLDKETLQKYAPETLKTIPEKVWDSSKVEKDIYGIPHYKEVGQQYGLMINTEIAKKYNIDYKKIKSWKDVDGVLEELHEKAPDVIGISIGNFFNAARFTQQVSPASFGVVNIPAQRTFKDKEDNEVFNQYDTPEFENFCKVMSKWYKSGYLPQNPQTYSDANARADDKAGRLFSWVVCYAPGFEKTYSVTVGHDIAYVPISPVLFMGASNFNCISAKSKNKEAALKLLELVNTDKTVGNLLRHGIEGVHYEKTGENQIKPISNSYGYEMGWQFGNVFNQDWVNTYPEDIEQRYKDYNEQAVDNPLVGFTFDTTNFKNQIAALSNVDKQYRDSLILGSVDIDSVLPDYLDAIKQNGGDELLKEMQKQVDEFVKSKDD